MKEKGCPNRTIRNFHYLEVSAKTGESVNKTFADCTRLILDYNQKLLLEGSGTSDSDGQDNTIFIDYSSKFEDFLSE